MVFIDKLWITQDASCKTDQAGSGMEAIMEVKKVVEVLCLTIKVLDHLHSSAIKSFETGKSKTKPKNNDKWNLSNMSLASTTPSK